MDQPIFERVAEAWRHMAKAPAALMAPGTVIQPVHDALICPPGWCGYVRIGDRVVITTPDVDRAYLLTRRGFDAVLGSVAGPDLLGPAVLAFADRPIDPPDVARITAADPRLIDMERAAGPDDAGEASVSECLSPVFVAFDGPDIVAAAGYTPWVAGNRQGAADARPSLRKHPQLAHIGVLTRTSHRGRGLAGRVSAAASAHAQAAGLIPQWRARSDNVASRAVARSLGFTEIGEQISFRWTLSP